MLWSSACSFCGAVDDADQPIGGKRFVHSKVEPGSDIHQRIGSPLWYIAPIASRHARVRAPGSIRVLEIFNEHRPYPTLRR